MQLTKANIDAIYFTWDLRFKTVYEATPNYWDQFATMAPSGGRENHYPWIAKIPRLRKWVGDRTLNNLQSRGYVLVNDDYEDTLALDRNDILDDQLGVYQGYLDALAQQAKLWPDDIVTAALEAGTTALAFDGQPFFHSAHPVDVDNSSAGTFQNNFDNTATGGSVSRPLTPANYQLIRSTMMGYKGEDGRSLNIVPDLLIVPPALEATGKQIVEADLLAPVAAFGAQAAQVGSNVLKGTAKLLVNPYLTSDTVWYMACTSRAIKPLIFQQRQAPVFVAKNNVTDDNVFFQKKFIFGVDARGAAGYSLPFLMARANT